MVSTEAALAKLLQSTSNFDEVTKEINEYKTTFA